MMKGIAKSRLWTFSVLVVACTCAPAVGQRSWQAARIYEVQKSVESKPLYWIANTPVTKDEATYRITVQLQEKLLSGVYSLDKSQGAPPEEWVRGRAVKIRLDGDDIYLKPLSGDDIKLRIVKRKRTTSMQPVTDAEMERAYTPSVPESLTGFADSGTTSKVAEPETAAAHAKADVAGTTTRGPVGVIDVTTAPYLAEIYVDGASLGYSPAKFTLAAGKHVLQAKKDGYQTWSKDVMVLDSSESTVAVELKKK